MATLICNQITRTTASRPGIAMPLSAALGGAMPSDWLVFGAHPRPVKQPDVPPALLISDSSITIDRSVSPESRKSCGNGASTKGALGMYAAQGAFITTSLGSRPPSPPV